MSADGWAVSDFWLETPSPERGGPHDLRGKGQVQIDKDGIHVTIRPRGVVGIMIPTKERRTFPIGQIVGWGGTGPKVEFTAGGIFVRDDMIGELITSTASAVPVHVCRFSCANPEGLQEMTKVLLTLGLARSCIGWNVQ
jgi:hypothetical protein